MEDLVKKEQVYEENEKEREQLQLKNQCQQNVKIRREEEEEEEEEKEEEEERGEKIDEKVKQDIPCVNTFDNEQDFKDIEKQFINKCAINDHIFDIDMEHQNYGEKHIIDNYHKLSKELSEIKTILYQFDNQINIISKFTSTFSEQLQQQQLQLQQLQHQQLQQLQQQQLQQQQQQQSQQQQQQQQQQQLEQQKQQQQQPKYEKITFNNEVTNSKVIILRDNIRVIVCDTSENFGKVVGKHGNNINYYKNQYNVTIAVPDQKESKKFPLIIVINDGHNPIIFDTVINEILNLLNYNKYNY